MAKNRWPRIKGGLPQGGLGLIGYGLSAIAFLCAVWIEAGMAVLIAVCSLVVCIWCAGGLWRDEAAGEIADQYVAQGSGVRLFDILSGQFESERRMSSDMLYTSAIALVIAMLRLVFGWGPVLPS